VNGYADIVRNSIKKNRSPMTEKPKILQRQTVANTKLFQVESLSLEFSNGQQRQYERLMRGHGHGAVLIVPLIDSNTVLLIKEYAAGLHRYELGLPKGKLDAGEDSLTAANREMQEEIGYAANKLHLLTRLSLAPSYMEHCIDIVIAEDLYPSTLSGDEPEPLEVVPWKLSELPKLMASGECTEARSIAALYLTLEHLKRLTVTQ
jgi:ADP-ribose diphosphatase